MLRKCLVVAGSLALSGCVVLPVSDQQNLRECETASERKRLQMVNLARESNSFLTITNVLLAPIVVPASALASGLYLVGNNTYHLAEKKFSCP